MGDHLLDVYREIIRRLFDRPFLPVENSEES